MVFKALCEDRSLRIIHRPYSDIKNRSEIIVDGSIVKLTQNKEESTSLNARILLPESAVDVVLQEDANKRFGRYTIHAKTDEGAKRLEDFQYATDWHRFCRHHDANFVTPIGWLLDLFKGRLARLEKRDARLFLFRTSHDSEGSYERLALVLGDGEATRVVTSADTGKSSSIDFDALEITSNGAISTRISLIDKANKIDLKFPVSTASSLA